MPPEAGRPQLRLAIVGAGLAGCALAAQLTRLGWPAPITLWEAGRGPGGRASTRRSRHDPQRRADHGAPLLTITTDPPPALLAPLLAGGWIEPWSEPCARLDASGALQPIGGEPLLQGSRYRGRGGMEQVCAGLLALAGGGCTLHSSRLIQRLEPRAGGGWRLLGREGEHLADADWLVLSGTLLVHPRGRALLGAAPAPLAALAAGDPQLAAALRAIAALGAEPRSNLIWQLEGAAAEPWLALPFRLLEFEAGAQRRWGLRRVSIQPGAQGRCAVVAHSSAALAAEHLQTVGSGSAALQLPGVRPDPEREQALITQLTAAVQAALAAWLPEATGQPPAGERQLMRWSAAFPRGEGLPAELSLCARSRLAFCGDYLAGPGFGRAEGAWRSGEQLAERLMGLLSPAGTPAMGAASGLGEAAEAHEASASGTREAAEVAEAAATATVGGRRASSARSLRADAAARGRQDND